METIINYSTYDFPFIEKVIIEAEKFSNKVYVVFYDHFFDGTPEDKDKIQDTKKFGTDKTTFISLKWDSTKDARFHHNNARWNGLQYCSEEYVLFLNSDEILNGESVNKFLQNGQHLNFDVMAFECYWYFREPIYQSIQTEQIGFIVKKSICNENYIFNIHETMAFKYTNGLKIAEFVRVDNEIVCHHFSWVKSKTDMIRKVVSWGHRHDRDWVSAVNEEFSRPFNGKDFVHGYSYRVVDNTFNLSINECDITLIAISGNEKYLDNTIKAAEYSNRKQRFKTKILSNKEFEHPFIECVLIDPVNSISEYNAFCLDKMVDYFDTTHVLIFQSDGFVLDSDRWDNDFLKYDYIGAPWPLWFEDVNINNCVGNGGFCLRSKKLLNLIKTYRLSDKDDETPEDVFICRKYRKNLEDSGMIWAPIETASLFSIEHQHDKNMNNQTNCDFINTFGFHAKAKVSDYMKLIA